MHFITIQQRPTAETRLSQLTLLLIFILNIVNVNSVCNGNRYDSPDPDDCLVGLTQFPQNKSIRYFVKQQLRSEPSLALWLEFQDDREVHFQKTIVQLPKWMSYD